MWVLEQLRRFKRAFVWDPEGQYKAQWRAGTRQQLASMLKETRGKPGTLAYTGKLGDFQFWAKCAWWWVRAAHVDGIGSQSAVVAEETADVTSPGKAPEDWGVLIRRGLKYGPWIFAITQRPAESDKTSIGNASVIHVCRLSLPRDRRYMADATGLPLEKIEGLRADQDTGKYDFITADMGAGRYVEGVLSFSGERPKFATKGAPESI